MMRNFAYVKAGSLAEAVQALSARGAKLHAGGTDLLGCIRSGIIPVDRVVSISGLKELKGISAKPDGGLRIGALTTVADIASGKAVADKYPALARAAAEVGSPQIREQGTLGGNLCQRPRCWYFRGDFPCLKKGGRTCFAPGGENQYHAVFGSGPCFCTHPSDLAVALVALEAQMLLAGPSGSRTVRADSFFVPPARSVGAENVLAPGEILTAVELGPPGGKSAFRKVRSRGSWDFALASAAAVVDLKGGMVRKARVVLGGVAPVPWRAEATEKALAGNRFDAALAASAGDAAAAGASPLRDNSYKLEMIRGVVGELLGSLG